MRAQQPDGLLDRTIDPEICGRRGTGRQEVPFGAIWQDYRFSRDEDGRRQMLLAGAKNIRPRLDVDQYKRYSTSIRINTANIHIGRKLPGELKRRSIVGYTDVFAAILAAGGGWRHETTCIHGRRCRTSERY